ncbi:MAG: flavoprotein [bacterium]|nr:flavoprotein [bacterium]
MKMLLGVTGSVAATLTPQLVTELMRRGHDVQVVTTAHATYFFDPTTLGIRVWQDAQEWEGERYVRDQEIPHIELRRWADALIIAPCSANTLAKLAAGQCDNLLTSIARAWDRTKPIILAPAMNTMMWEHPATAEHLAVLRRWCPHLAVVEPAAKRLACGDTGVGALAPIAAIVDAITNA